MAYCLAKLSEAASIWAQCFFPVRAASPAKTGDVCGWHKKILSQNTMIPLNVKEVNIMMVIIKQPSSDFLKMEKYSLDYNLICI